MPKMPAERAKEKVRQKKRDALYTESQRKEKGHSWPVLYPKAAQKKKGQGRARGKPSGRGQGFAKRKGVPFEHQSQRCREDLQKETTMEKFKHKYIFYFYPNLIDIAEGRKGIFRFFGRSKDGKEFAAKTSRQYDYKKIY